MRKISVLTRGGLALVMMSLLPQWAMAVMTFSAGAAGAHFIPVNAKQVVVYSFSLTAGSDNEALKQVTIQNPATGVRFGAGISSVSIYLDSNGNGTIAANQTPLGSTNPSTDTAIITLNSPILNGNTQRFLVAYDLDSTATIGQSGNCTLKTGGMLNAAGGAITYDVNPQSSNFTVTGFSTATGTSLAPGIVVPNQLTIPMLKFNLQSTGENVDGISITVANESSNFVDKNSSKDGVVAAYLYLDSNGNGKLDPTAVGNVAADTLLQTVDGSNLSTKDSVTFSSTKFSAPLLLSDGISRSLFVAYDLGENTVVTKDSAISAKISAASGTGQTSRVTVAMLNSTPVTPAKAYVSGISIGSLVGLNSGTSFGAGASAAIMKMKLRAQNGSVTLNQITIQDSGSIKYVTDSSSNSGISRINIYDDAVKNETLDQGDRLIGSLRLGNGGGQTDTIAPVTIKVPGTTDGLNIPTYNSTLDNATTIFVEYVIGTDVKPQQDASGNATSVATAELVSVLASSNVSSAQVSLTGTLPASATPSAQLAVGNTNLIINNVTDLSPNDVFTGQTKVPMLGFSLTAAQTLSSANIQIRNTNGSFSGFGQGVSKVWLYEDSGTTVGSLDSGDKFLAATSQFDSSSVANLYPISIPQRTTQYLVLYDIGLLSSSSGAAAQIDNILPTANGTAITFIGQKPIPTSPAASTINTLALAVNDIALSTTSITEKTSTLTVDIGVKNNSGRNVTITQASPRFLKNNAFGEDTTYSFSITPINVYPIQLAAGDSVTLSFSANAANLVFNGTMAVDAALTAQVNASTTVTIQRFKTSATTWQSAASNPAQLTAKSNTLTYDWNLPGFISSMSIRSGTTDIPFQNRDAIPAHSQLKLQLAESGRGIDPATLAIGKKTKTGNQLLSLNSDYTYDVSSGLITIQDVGDANIILQVGASDNNKNTLPVANIWVTISDQLKISEFYAFPNPFVPNGGSLTFGFNATQTGDAVISILNSSGHKVAEKSFSISTIGYQKVSWDGRQSDGNIIFSGIYYAVITATDSNGNKAYANTRLAIY